MNAKSERFELRLEPETLERIDRWRQKQRDDEGPWPSRAEAVRTLIEDGLERAGQPILRDGEKLIVRMLCELYEHLKVRSGFDIELISEALLGGHYWALAWEYPGIFHSHEDHNSVVTEVVRILDMWSFLESGFRALSAEARAEVETVTGRSDVRFIGFDGNNESEHLHIARFLIEKMGRFQSFAGRRDLNSHCPVLDGYRRMSEVFEPIRPTLLGRELSAKEIIKIMNERIPPRRL